jgi:hypothetical protein
METVESKISGLYIGLVIFLHFAILMIILISSTFLRDIFNIEKRIIAGVIIISMLISFILLWQEILSAKKVVVDLNGIKIFNAQSVREIAFSEIDKIQKGKVKTMLIKGVPFSDGYTYSEIILKQGENVIISPDKYDNYIEIMVFIDNQIDKQQLS